MPIYDYTCAACGHLTEVIHGMREGGPRFCPSCGAEGTMRKGFAAPAVHFKGSGWAKKERSSKPSGSAKESGEPAKSDGESGKPGGESGKSGGESGQTGVDASSTAPADSSKLSSSSSSEAS